MERLEMGVVREGMDVVDMVSGWGRGSGERV